MVPPSFAHHVSLVYEDIGVPPVTDEPFWRVYSKMNQHFQELATEAQQEEFETALKDQHSCAFDIDVELLAQKSTWHKVRNMNMQIFLMMMMRWIWMIRMVRKSLTFTVNLLSVQMMRIQKTKLSIRCLILQVRIVTNSLDTWVLMQSSFLFLDISLDTCGGVEDCPDWTKTPSGVSTSA
jgi:hypothetical protein